MYSVIHDAGLKTDTTQIRNILNDTWGLESKKNSDYIFYHIGIDGELVPLKRKGRYLKIEKELTDKILL